MIYGIAIDSFYGIRQKRAYVCEHEGDGFMPLHDGLEAQYVTGHQQPNYPVPARRYVVKKDYSDIHPGKVIGLMLGATDYGLLEYWPKEV